MSRKYLALAAACALGAAGLAHAEAPSTGLTPDQIVGARHSAFLMSIVTFNAMRRAVDGTAEAKTQAYPANALATWAKTLPTLFPAGTGPGAVSVKTRAKAEIWTDRAGFDKAAEDYAAATAKLVDLAKANDTAGFKAQIAEVDKTCDACHDKYRSK